MYMGDIEIFCCHNHPLKYHNYCKYDNVHLVGYNFAIKLNSQTYGIILYHLSRNFDIFWSVAMLYNLYILQLGNNNYSSIPIPIIY